MDELEREQANTIREQHLHISENYSELYCECDSCGRRKTLRIRALNRALHRVAAALDDELGQRLIDFSTIYWYINDAFAIHAVERKWRVLRGYLYCPQCMSTVK
ncbi:MAG: hypothetical protein ACE5I3_09330 [Phycisphaerae bacterium]